MRPQVASNTIVLCEGADHPALRRRALCAAPPLWVAGAQPAPLRLEGGELRCAARVRYQQPLARCAVRLHSAAAEGDAGAAAGGGDGAGQTLHVTFEEPLLHVAEQQALVLYAGEVCLGAANIVARGPSAYEEQHGLSVEDLASHNWGSVGTYDPARSAMQAHFVGG